MNRPESILRSRPFDQILTGEFLDMDHVTIRPRGTDDWLIIYTYDGAGIVANGGLRHEIVRGDILLSPPGTPHDYRTSQRTGHWALLWAHFEPRAEWLDWLRWPGLTEGGRWGRLHVKGATEKKMQDRLRQMHHYASKPQGFGRHSILAMNALEEVLLWCDAANESRRVLMDEPTRIVLDTISSRYAEPLTLAFLARRSGQSVARLTRQFRKHAGASVQAVIEHRRLDRARQLLIHTTLSVKEIASQTGFASPFYFSVRFKSASGLSPRNYRNKMREALG